MADIEMRDADPPDDEPQDGTPPPENNATEQENDERSEEEDDEEEDSSDGEPYLAVTRERRANAGNRMSKLLEAAGAEDEAAEDYADIFQEAANDEEFEEAYDEGDISLSSSDDDDDGVDQDEEQGERELKREERQQDRKKRKRETLMQQMMRKKAAQIGLPPPTASSTAPTTPMPAASRPKKKSERVSWLPEEGEGPTRASSRKLAVLNKQSTHERLKEKEKNRLELVEKMKVAELKKEANKPKALTQADRLAEAARIERQNSKSVHKWEETEKKRSEEQRAKLAALKSRKLDGPVISYYSGPALWINDRLKHVGKGKVVEETLKETPRQDIVVLTTQPAEEVKTTPLIADINNPTSPSGPTIVPYTAGEAPSTHEFAAAPETAIDNSSTNGPGPTQSTSEAQTDFLQGIHYYAGLEHQEPGAMTATAGPVQSPLTSTVAPASTSTPSQTAPASQTSMPPLIPTQPLQPLPQAPNLYQTNPQLSQQPPPHLQSQQRKVELSTRNLISLRSFEFPKEHITTNAIKSAAAKETRGDPLIRALLDAPDFRSGKLKQAQRSTCSITDSPARYRDPVTGLPYADVYGLKMIRKLAEGRCIWSSLLGAYVGADMESTNGRPAAGVPEGFLKLVEKKTEEPKEVSEPVSADAMEVDS
jgi:vacuolar protein sorting-associated protein 72